MSEIHLNKYEKEKRVIELHLAGKTIREIAKELHMSFTPISKIIKAYEKKIILQTKKEEQDNNQQKITTTKKLSLSSRAFILFKEGKKIEEAKVLLDIPFKLAIRYWKQYLKSIRMFEAFEFYQDHSYDIPRLLSICNFIKNNHVNIYNITDILKEAKHILNLEVRISILKYEIAELKQTKNNYLLNKNTKHQLPHLGPLPKYYNW
jgi:transposase